ncbi:class I SAM-dependent DNA methyltransferase, partial [Pseudanabaenaceae cyanobacterium LEGE 13415]|nr:class I SAM-dependent DNA methyltransferase [Pseudanabaenaceae cyanobacterium LEGE 13415]
VQAIAYTRNLSSKPPFLLTCDIGDHFELWLGFNGDYGGYGARQEIALTDLRDEETFDLFVDIFTDPQKRNPEKIAAKVTREVAADLAELSRRLEGVHEAHEVAAFLMRCIFTMFAEDVGLLKEQLFTQALETRWLPNPNSFRLEVESLWQAMNDGTTFGFYGRLLRFNGGLFAESKAFELTKGQLEVLHRAAKREWKDVEPAIFGTLLERALDSRERSKLGAHYTPRSYVERLVRPVVLEPLREQWDLVQLEVKQALNNGELEPTEKQKKKAIELLEAFLKELREIRILDPACGSGNFLYVTLDLLKGLESEVLKRLADVVGGEQLRIDDFQVNPSQFLGIEINPRAAAIADLVIWIGYLQWHFRRFGDIPPVEPVLREYKNIECRDAVLDYDGKEPDVDPATGKVRTRWGGRMMKSPVTSEEVPDPTDQVVIYKYLNPRAAEWQEADYIVSNPPFIGNGRMRDRLGDGYTKTLRQVYQDVPETVDYVMYWWHKAAALIRSQRIRKFGFITTNTIRQVWQRSVIDFHVNQKESIRLFFAIPDHPWADEGASVRIAMTAAEPENLKSLTRISTLGTVTSEREGITPEDSADQIKVNWQNAAQIFSNLRTGANVSSAIALKSNSEVCCPGVKLHGMGFCLNQQEAKQVEAEITRPYLNGRDLTQTSRNVMVIDLLGLTANDVLETYPKAYQWVYERVKPERDQNNREAYRQKWWIFGEPRVRFRPALENINRYIGTPQTSKHRFFVFIDAQVIPDNQIIAIALDDAYCLGVLSSRIHVAWALAAGGRLGVGNDPRYNKTVCFDPFPFPDATDAQKQTIRDLAERLDTHRKRVQAAHPSVTITAMYNLLEKIRAGQELTENDRAFNQKALVSTLKQIHDDLDAAVFAAYGWSINITDDQILENLVTLNAQRAEEERNGLIRWLRPDYQAPNETHLQVNIEGISSMTAELVTTPVEQQKLPKAFKDQLAAVRDLLRTQGGEWSIEQITAQFKNATRQKQAILTCLESLEALGIVARHGEENIDRWYLAELQKVS